MTPDRPLPAPTRRAALFALAAPAAALLTARAGKTAPSEAARPPEPAAILTQDQRVNIACYAAGLLAHTGADLAGAARREAYDRVFEAVFAVLAPATGPR